jgi:hypothetical protein
MTIEPGTLVIVALAAAGVACIALIGFLLTGTSALIRTITRRRPRP